MKCTCYMGYVILFIYVLRYYIGVKLYKIYELKVSYNKVQYLSS